MTRQDHDMVDRLTTDEYWYFSWPYGTKRMVAKTMLAVQFRRGC